jgi:protoporphyrinogen oxidase
MARIVIIGAGLTGLSTAYHLEKIGFTDFKIFEKERTVGGLCRSVEQDGFTFDYTGHLLHSSDPYFSSLLKDIIGLESFNTINRRSFIYSHNTYTHYPFQSNLHGLPLDVITECIQEFVLRPTKEKTNENFHDWAVRKFGAGIVKHFFAPYQQKIFAYDSKKIAASWTSRFVPDTSLKNIIAGISAPTINNNTGYNSQFLYPKTGGINFWIKKFAATIKTPIQTKYCVESIDTKNKIITFTNGDFEKYETLVTTMPLDTLLSMTKEPSSSSLKKASKKLLCNSIANFNLGVQSDKVSNKHWIYLPESKFPHYRMGFYHNFSKAMAPTGCSSLYGEYAYLNKTHDQVKSTVRDAVTSTRNLLNISDAQVVTERTMHISHAYVIFDFWREKNLPKLHTTLESQNIHSIGRYGAWKYSSMQEAVLDGKTMAEQLTGKDHGTVQEQESVGDRGSRIHRVTSS